jgi:hypothetical protein
MKTSCGCCEGIRVVTPASIWNRPGLDAITYRVGTHATFFESMLARISNVSVSLPALNATDPPGLIWPLRTLTTRDTSDSAIALLDAWAVVSDVLTFYQERIANEGYLRTALERRSVLELARLAGYRLRPGVSSSVFLAFTLQKGSAVDIPAGTQAQSVPGPGELPQYFETSAVLPARDIWNSLEPRFTRPQLITWDGDPVFDAANIDMIYLDGTSTNLNPNDTLLLVSDNTADPPVLRRILDVLTDSDHKRTRITLQSTRSLLDADQLLQQKGPAILSALDQSIADAQTTLSGVGMAEAIVARLTTLETVLKQAIADNDAEAFFQALQGDVAYIREQQAIALERNYTRLAPWIDTVLSSLVPDLALFTNLPKSAQAKRMQQMPVTASQSEKRDGLSLSLAQLDRFLRPLSVAPSIQPANSARLERTLGQSLGTSFFAASDGTARLLRLLRSDAASQFYNAWSSVATNPSAFRVFAMRTKVSLFGSGAPKEPQYVPSGGDPPASNAGDILPQSQWPDWNLNGDESNNQLFLERNVDKILPGSFVAVQKDGSLPQIFGNVSVAQISRNAYGVSAKTSRITLAGSDEWWNTDADKFEDVVRKTTVYAQSEQLVLAETPIDEDVAGAEIELAQLYDGLDSGRWIVVAGERTDTNGATGITASELVMISAVNQGFGAVYRTGDPSHSIDPPVAVIPPGEKVHTTLVLANELAYTYDRSTLKIYANVTKATHGKSQAEAIGSGDGSKSLQTFPLRQSPLTYLPAVTPQGAASTLQIRVNDILWNEADDLSLMAPGDHSYITQADNSEVASVTFGTGKRGARLPTGPENVKSAYRNGIGSAGNAAAQQISQLVTRPLGVKDVINPLRASGGADRDTVDQARDNAPLAVMSLDRIVSVQDYADFARSFAGIGKASSARFTGRAASMVHVTIAGVDDIPIDPTSDLYAVLLQSMQKYGDPFEQIKLDARSLIVLIISARVRVSAAYLWEAVEARVRAHLLDAFGFRKRALGQSAFLSEVISSIQQVPGVEYVKVDGFGGVPDTNDDGSPIGAASLLASINKQLVQADGTPVPPRNYVRAQTDFMDKQSAHPAQLAYLSPAYPDSLILKEIK